ncbi:bifunctional oligoribonuclease/PAP phosphatase NrnA [Paludibacter sp. 221]|uniref:DHH family phosphoesterase n=1 Tax=Paludibacter sp. 221 TaxID=2302939 RepID=UPI0013D78E22|nr:bifunctional oligoribonuclease/PAP phosphatase NrnA [Paludibacter sp. 221]NDV45740.1 bifunctional oligoribonuclease/PAP phosphatase NrnA [Paludibacter sp. 221]
MLSKIIAEDLVSRLREAIDIKEKIVIVSHVGPDGDAVGSSLALWHYLHQLGKTAQVIVPSAFPSFLDWMPGASNIIVYEKDKEKADDVFLLADLIFALDFNTPSRVDKMQDALLNSPAPKILIDHHLHPDSFAQIVISYPEISSTSELVFRAICRMGHFDKITLECAQCIMTGMMTDTGGFTYNSNQPEIYNIISELIKLGVDKDDIYRKVFNTFSVDRLKLSSFCVYKKMKVFPKYKAALIALSMDELEKFNYRQGDTEGIVNMPLSIEGVIFSVLMREDSDKIKISLRSQGAFPANKVASDLFGGGGHLNAAGGESYMTLKETVDKFKKALPDYLEFLEEQE